MVSHVHATYAEKVKGLEGMLDYQKGTSAELFSQLQQVKEERDTESSMDEALKEELEQAMCEIGRLEGVVTDRDTALARAATLSAGKDEQLLRKEDVTTNLQTQCESETDAAAALKEELEQAMCEIDRLEAKVGELEGILDGQQASRLEGMREVARLEGVVDEKEISLSRAAAEREEDAELKEELKQVFSEVARLKGVVAEKDAALVRAAAESAETVVKNGSAGKAIADLEEKLKSAEKTFDDQKRLVAGKDESLSQKDDALKALNDEVMDLKENLKNVEKSLEVEKKSAAANSEATKKLQSETEKTEKTEKVLAALEKELQQLQTTAGAKDTELKALSSETSDLKSAIAKLEKTLEGERKLSTGKDEAHSKALNQNDADAKKLKTELEQATSEAARLRTAVAENDAALVRAAAEVGGITELQAKVQQLEKSLEMQKKLVEGKDESSTLKDEALSRKEDEAVKKLQSEQEASAELKDELEQAVAEVKRLKSVVAAGGGSSDSGGAVGELQAKVKALERSLELQKKLVAGKDEALGAKEQDIKKLQSEQEANAELSDELEQATREVLRLKKIVAEKDAALSRSAAGGAAGGEPSESSAGAIAELEAKVKRYQIMLEGQKKMNTEALREKAELQSSLQQLQSQPSSAVKAPAEAGGVEAGGVEAGGVEAGGRSASGKSIEELTSELDEVREELSCAESEVQRLRGELKKHADAEASVGMVDATSSSSSAAAASSSAAAEEANPPVSNKRNTRGKADSSNAASLEAEQLSFKRQKGDSNGI